MAKRDEYKVHVKDERGRKSFTLVNAGSEDEARRVAEKHHGAGDRPKVVTSVEETGRSF